MIYMCPEMDVTQFPPFTAAGGRAAPPDEHLQQQKHEKCILRPLTMRKNVF